MELIIYIAGKITGEDPETCKIKFASVEAKLKKIGVQTVINPLNLGIPATWNWTAARETCMKVLRDKANSILLLNDWVHSEGAMEEYQFAKNHGLRIFCEDDTEEMIQLLAHSGKWIDTSHLEFPG